MLRRPAAAAAGLGVPPRVVMENLGHSDIRLTMNLYSHVFSELQRDAANQMDDLFDPATHPDPDAVARPVARRPSEGSSKRGC